MSSRGALAMPFITLALVAPQTYTVVDNSFQLGEWEKAPNSPGVDPVGVEREPIRILAQPF